MAFAGASPTLILDGCTFELKALSILCWCFSRWWKACNLFSPANSSY